MDTARVYPDSKTIVSVGGKGEGGRKVSKFQAMWRLLQTDAAGLRMSLLAIALLPPSPCFPRPPCRDMPLKAPPAEVAAAFEALQLPEDPQARNQTLFDFVQQAGFSPPAYLFVR